ncbi:hypothetical protein [Flavobacterium difficile]|uniref:Leucine-rich repeat domain-containing protein n=1 Tax=Flavobacterium difficile TaxID=2709659 RepID=A0ABX0I2F7_9FLAO|nr:hypothetical protein [Flavobacterium difficile]NHM01353.1 hypothetical protein [Flavobacterium difficile]
MKNILFLFVLIVSNLSFGQCQKCASITEASKEPEKVNYLILNEYANPNVVLTSFPKEIETYKNLEILYVINQKIKEIPEFIGNFSKLYEINFSGNQLEKLPNTLFELKNLKKITLRNNNFSSEYLIELKKKFSNKLPNTTVILE